VCTRFHEVDLKITRAGKLMTDLAWLGDFGRAEAFENKSALSPTTCPTQYADTRAESSGSRRISVQSTSPRRFGRP
jgi:hypothetical protein